MIPAYPGFSVLAAIVVVALELKVFRTSLFRQKAYWIAMVVIVAFQIPVDGWMTKLSAPIIRYNDSVLSGWRWPLDIPTEEFIYAWAMLTLVMLLWERAGRCEAPSTTEERAKAGILGRQ